MKESPVVVAAANDDDDAFDYSPGSVGAAITVGGTDATDKRFNYQGYRSNYGSCLDLFAPGQSVPTYKKNGGSYMPTGTSLSSPLVAGVVAQILDQDYFATPGFISFLLDTPAITGQVSEAGSGSPNRLVYSLTPYMYIDGPSLNNATRELDVDGQALGWHRIVRLHLANYRGLDELRHRQHDIDL
jgi:subtilisin family serine protease